MPLKHMVESLGFIVSLLRANAYDTCQGILFISSLRGSFA